MNYACAPEWTTIKSRVGYSQLKLAIRSPVPPWVVSSGQVPPPIYRGTWLLVDEVRPVRLRAQVSPARTLLQRQVMIGITAYAMYQLYKLGLSLKFEFYTASWLRPLSGYRN
jgi:hypothetical protein